MVSLKIGRSIEVEYERGTDEGPFALHRTALRRFVGSPYASPREHDHGRDRAPSAHRRCRQGAVRLLSRVRVLSHSRRDAPSDRRTPHESELPAPRQVRLLSSHGSGHRVLGEVRALQPCRAPWRRCVGD